MNIKKVGILNKDILNQKCMVDLSTIFALYFANPKNILMILLTDYTMATEFCSYQMSLYVVLTYLMLKWHFYSNDGWVTGICADVGSRELSATLTYFCLLAWPFLS